VRAARAAVLRLFASASFVDAARADHGDVGGRIAPLVVAVPKQRFADLVRVGVRDLAAEGSRRGTSPRL